MLHCLLVSGQDVQAQWAAYYAQMYAAQQNQAGAGSSDYTKQWIEYYRAYGMEKEAEMLENMAKQSQVIIV